MTLRAIIFDVYGTLIRVGPPPADADARWEQLFHELLGGPPSLGRLEFSVACSRVIARQHTAARARGIPYPEVLWPLILAEALPGFARLRAEDQVEFVFRQMQLGRTIELCEGAGDVLRDLRDQGRFLAIASNSQAYTLRELEEKLGEVGLGLDLFDCSVNFWSFDSGFSKPDPHVFQMLTARLEARGYSPAETLMVGDRLDNDVAPAQACGWQTWRILPHAGDGVSAGNWRQLQARLSAIAAG